MKRKTLSTSVAVNPERPVVPRVRVRHGHYVVPRVRLRPHGTERKLLGIKRVCDIGVPSSEDVGDNDESPHECRKHKRLALSDESVHASSVLSDSDRSSPRPGRVRRLSEKSGSSSGKNNKKDDVWYSSSLAHKPHSLSLSFSSHRVRVAGSVDDHDVDNITIDTATDVSVVSHEWLKSHPTLRRVKLKRVPPAAVALSAANGSAINVLGFVDFSLTLGGSTCTVTALVVPSLGPDRILLDNQVMDELGAVLNWSQETLFFPSTGESIPAVHRKNTAVPSRTNNRSPAPNEPISSVAAVHSDAKAIAVKLCERVNLKSMHEALAVAFTDCLPPQDCTVIVEPRIVSETEISDDNSLAAFKNIVVARTLSTWKASDGSVAVQIANPSTDGVALPVGLCLGQLFTVSVVSPDQLHVNAVANTPKTAEEIRRARSELEGPLKKAFADTTLTPDQQASVLDLCAKFRPVFSLSMAELGRCTIAEATFPVPPGTRPVDRPPYRPNPRASAVIDKCVQDMLDWDIIEERPSPWGSPCTIVAKSNGSPRFCVDYRHTLNRHIVRKSWPMPNLESCLDAVGEALYITVCDVLSAFWQIPVATEHIDRTAFVTPHGKYCFKRMPFGVCNAPWLFQQIMSMALGHLGPDSGVLAYMDDLICISPTFESHLKSLERMFAALQAAGLTLKPSKVQFGQKQIEYLGHVISAKGITVSTERIEAIRKLPTPTCIKDLRSVLGMFNFVRRFVKDYAEITSPLVDLTRKEFTLKKKFKAAWGSAQDEAFAKVKEALTSAPVLHFPDFSREFVVHTDASEQGVGAFLAQPSKDSADGKDLDIVAYYSKRFSKSQRHYSPTMKECLAVVWAFVHWRPYLWGRHFTCHTDHQALTYLYQMQDTSNMLTRWAIALQSFDFTVKHVPGKLNVVPDTLSRIFSEVNGEEISSEPKLAAICRNVPEGQPFHPPAPREYEVSAHNLDEIEPVESDRELFTSAVSVFPAVDSVKLLDKQKEEFGQYFDYLNEPQSAPVPSRQSKSSMSKFFLHEGLLYHSYRPGHLRRRGDFRDQLVVPESLRKLVIHACHDLPSSGGHLAFKATFDKVRDRYWWPTMHSDVQQHVNSCISCQHRKTSHRPPALPVGHRPVERPFQCVAVDLVEYKSASEGNRYILSVIDHFTRFVILIAIKNKEATTIVRNLMDRVFSIFGPPETLHSDQGTEFENQLVKELQNVFGYSKTRTAAYRPQGNSVLERVHSTLHSMLAMYSNLACDNWAELLPFVQLAHNTAYSSTLHETPHYLVFGRAPLLPVDLILGVPATDTPQSRLDYSRRTVENLQLAYELVRRNLKERVSKQASANEKLSFPSFTSGEKVLVHRPYHETDGPNPKLYSPWHGPYVVRSKLSPVTYRVSKPDDQVETTVHLGRMKKYVQPTSSPVPDLEALDELFLGTSLPVPDLDGKAHKVMLGPYVVEYIDGHKRSKGAGSPENFQYHLKLKDYPTQRGKWLHHKAIPQCHEMVKSYRAQVLSKDPTAFDPPRISSSSPRPSRKSRSGPAVAT